MSEKKRQAPGDDPSSREQEGEVTLELDGQNGDLEAAMREAVAAVEWVKGGAPSDREPAVTDDPPADGEVAQLRREIADLRDRSVRTLADYDNYRKRADRERQEVRRYALQEPLREIMPVVDNLERALSADGSAQDLKTGVAMILKQLQDLLRRLGVHEVPAEGEVFDPSMHEAVSREERAGVEVPTVAETLVRGYLLHDRLLRPAMVKVAIPPEKRREVEGEEAS
jgi:molecular chaperone GrpE